MNTPEEFLEANGFTPAEKIDRQYLISLFISEMEKGLKGEPSSLRMIPAYVGVNGRVPAGAKAAVKGKNPERLVRALRMIRLYEELSLPKTGEDFDTLRKELHNSYNLLKRKGQ